MTELMLLEKGTKEMPREDIGGDSCLQTRKRPSPGTESAEFPASRTVRNNRCALPLDRLGFKSVS